MEIKEILNGINDFFYTNKTKDVDFRLEQLKHLRDAVKKYEPEFIRALSEDLRKPEFEAYITETGFVLHELNYAIKHLKKWARAKRVPSPFWIMPAKSMIIKEPFGTVLIIGPYNYPVQLLLCPLIGAIAAGNCAVVKSSKNTPKTSEVLHRMISETFNPNYIKSIHPTEIPSVELVSAPFDYIFFTGSTQTAKSVAKAAAENLTPVTLELGGKSPTIVDKTADLQVAAKRIAWGKFLNSGQTCIAPDYVFVHEEVRNEFIELLVRTIRHFYGVFVQESPDFGRIVNEQEFFRLRDIIEKENANIISGGQTDECGLYIEPTLIDASFDSYSMQQEIFGPILPILTWTDIDEVIRLIRTKPKPLALYIFSKNKDLNKKVIKSLSFGGGGVNDTLNQLMSAKLPFGGIGLSGMGEYHGKYTFDTFTHEKSIIIRDGSVSFDKFFPPYSEKALEFAKKFFN